MGHVPALLVALALGGESSADHVQVDLRVVVPDALTGLGKVVSEPKVVTLSGTVARLRTGGTTKQITGDDGTDQEVPLGVIVEVAPVVLRRGPQAGAIKLTCAIVHTISSPNGILTRRVHKEVVLQSGERHVMRVSGEGHHAPVTAVLTPRLLESLEARR